MTRYAGKGGVVYVAPTVGGAAVAVVGLSKWSLDQTTEKIDVTAFGDPNKEYVQSLKDVKGQMSGIWDDTSSDTLFQASDAGAVNMYLYPTKSNPAKYWYGTAFLDASIDTDLKDAVKVSSSFVAGGAWGRL